MPIKKKTKKKLPIVHIILLSLAALVVIALTFFLTKNFYQEQRDRQLLHEQKMRLDAAEADIKSISESFLAQFTPEEVKTKEFKKDCAESSVKYGHGTITCGPDVFIIILTDKALNNLPQYETKIEILVRDTTGLDPEAKPYIRGIESKEGRLFELSSTYGNSKQAKCYFSVYTYTPAQYRDIYDQDSAGKNAVVLSMACRDTVQEPIYPLAN